MYPAILKFKMGIKRVEGMTDQFQHDPKKTEVLMTYVLEHYVKHSEVVLKKLGHAQTATHKSINEIESKSDAPADKPPSELKQMYAYDQMWDKVISQFRVSGLTEDELSQIERVLDRIPRMIKKYYDLLVEQDKILQELMRDLESVEYKKAMELVKRIQSQPDLLSGLAPDEFDLEHGKHAYIFKVPNLKDTLH